MKKRKKLFDDRIQSMALYVLMAIIAITPLIVYLNVHDFSSYLGLQPDAGMDADFFSYNKAVFLIVLSLVYFVLYAYQHRSNQFSLRKSSFDISIGIYIVLVLLSAILSDHKAISGIGYLQRYEGAVILVAYGLLLFTTSKYEFSEKQINQILKALVFSSAVIGLIGFFQFFKMDLFKTSFGLKLIMPASFNLTAEQLTFNMAETQIYSTLPNSNYLGSYFPMVLPLLGFAMFYFKKWQYRIPMGIVFALAVFNLLGSRSRAGQVAISVVALLAIVLFRKHIITKWKYSVVGVLIILVSFITVNHFTNDLITNRIKSTWNQVTESTETYSDFEVLSNGDTLEIGFQEERLWIRDRDQGVVFLDADENMLEVATEGELTKILDPRFADYQFKLPREGMNILSVQFKGYAFRFVNLENDFKLLLTDTVAVDLEPVEKWGFSGRERWGSSRGYIWSRSLPLLKDTLIIGYGPDTYALNFPQYDFIGKRFFLDTTQIVVDKPHNLYLQSAINTGVLSLAALLFIFALYLKQSFLLYFRPHQYHYDAGIGSAIFLGVCGYLVSGFFNDSVVSVAPLFWIFLGLGFSINNKYKKLIHEGHKAR